MKFNTTLNGGIVTVSFDEYEAFDMDGTVNDVDVTFEGLEITSVVSDIDYEALKMEAEEHLSKHRAQEAIENAMYRAEIADSYIGRGAV